MLRCSKMKNSDERRLSSNVYWLRKWRRKFRSRGFTAVNFMLSTAS
jgi:hypothetical protein